MGTFTKTNNDIRERVLHQAQTTGAYINIMFIYCVAALGRPFIAPRAIISTIYV